MRVLVSPTAFKGTLSPMEAATALGDAARRALPDAEVMTLPIADGGDGTSDVLLSAAGGVSVEHTVTGPAGRPITAAFAWLDNDVAVIEMATASGISLIHPSDLDPMKATSRGTGDLIAAALERRPRQVIVGVGGTASSDGGSGIAEAIGISMLDSKGRSIAPGAQGLLDLDAIHLDSRDPSIAATTFLVACDVTNPMLGPNGAALVFGPQKGASSGQVEVIERALTRFSEVVARSTGVALASMPMAGAAGGAAGGMHALLGAQLRGGFDLIADVVGFDEALLAADLLIVGEGSLDDQSLEGKAPIAAARRARRAGVPVWAFAGRVTLSQKVLSQEGIEVWADLTELVGPRAQTHATESLALVAERMLSRARGQRRLS